MCRLPRDRIAFVYLFLFPAMLAAGIVRAAGAEAGSGDPNDHIIKGLAPLAQGSPFRLAASFRLKGLPGKKADGSYVLEWKAAGDWREEIVYPGYRRVRTADEGFVRQESSTPVQPLRIFDLEELLSWVARPDLAPNAPDAVVSAEQDRSSGTGFEPPDDPIASAVVGDRGSSPPKLPGRIEFSTRDGDDLVVAGVGNGFPFTERFRFDEPGHFRGRFVPRKLAYAQRGKTVVKLTIEALTALREGRPGPATALAAPGRFPVGCKRFDSARVTRFESFRIPVGSELFAARYVVGTDGRLHDLVVLRSAGPDHDSYYKAELRQQEWQPALCDGVRVDSAMLYTTETNLAIGIGEAAGRLPGRPRD